MFLINGKPLSEFEYPKEYRWMHKKFDEIRAKGKKTFTFSAFNKRAHFLRDDNRVVPQKERTRLVSITGHTQEPTGVYQTWSYATSMNALKSDGADGYKLMRATIPMEYTTVFDVDRDIELIFFFLYISKNRNVKMVDHEARRKAKAEAAARRSKAEYYIYNPESPIHPENFGSDSQLRNLAMSWGVSGAMNIDIYAVMNSLWGAVRAAQENYGRTGKGYKEFIEDVEKFGDTGRRALVALAIEKGVISFDRNIWKMVTPTGSERVLCGVPPEEKEKKNEYVMQYILNNDILYSTVEAAIEDPTPMLMKKAEEVKKNDPENMKRHELLAAARDLGWIGPHYKTLTKMRVKELVILVKEKRTPRLELETELPKEE